MPLRAEDPAPIVGCRASGIAVHSSLLNAVLHDQPQIKI